MKKLIFLLFIIPILFTFSCSTDFDINADWKDIAVVYGLLDKSDTVQYIKLNKAFLGDEDAYIMAQESDSLFYNNAEVSLEPLLNGNNIFDDSGNIYKIELIKTNDIPKEDGIFATDRNTLFKTTESLNSDYDYKLIINIPGKDVITATTSLIDKLKVIKPTLNPAEKIGIYNAQQQEYLDYKVKFVPNEKGKLYGLTIRFHYREHTPKGDYDYFIDWVQSNKKSPVNVDANTEMSMTINGALFYNFVGSNIEQGDPAIKREALGLDFIFIVAGEELSLYMEVNAPSQGIVQEKPAFTNISNGIGVFSSRFSKHVDNKELSNLAIDELSCGEATKHLRFADQYGNYDCLNN